MNLESTWTKSQQRGPPPHDLVWRRALNGRPVRCFSPGRTCCGRGYPPVPFRWIFDRGVSAAIVAYAPIAGMREADLQCCRTKGLSRGPAQRPLPPVSAVVIQKKELFFSPGPRPPIRRSAVIWVQSPPGRRNQGHLFVLLAALAG